MEGKELSKEDILGNLLIDYIKEITNRISAVFKTNYEYREKAAKLGVLSEFSSHTQVILDDIMKENKSEKTNEESIQ